MTDTFYEINSNGVRTHPCDTHMFIAMTGDYGPLSHNVARLS